MSSTVHTRRREPGPPQPPRGRQGRGRSRGRWASFVLRYGWRAYALPVLSAVTVATFVHSGASTHHVVADRSAGFAASTSSAPPGGTGVQVEGRTAQDAGFAAGSTPAPVVVDLGDDAISCATNTHARLVLVSLSQQHLWACAGGKQVRSTPVTTGASAQDDQTPKGSWLVQAKERDRYLVGAGYRDYVHYWVPFNGDFGLHDASWQTMPFGSADYTTRGSHGCVHVPTATMSWLYRWVQVGDTVVTVES